MFRFHTEELDHTFWQYESGILRDNNESMDSYTGQDLPLEYDDRSYYTEGSLERDMIQFSPQSQSKYRRRYFTYILLILSRRNNIDKTYFL